MARFFALVFSGVVQVSEQTLKEGITLIELLRAPVTNIRGEDVTPEYTSSVAHVQNTLDELRERKQRSDELSDVRRIKLQQLLQLRTCEGDAEQVCIFTFPNVFIDNNKNNSSSSSSSISSSSSSISSSSSSIVVVVVVVVAALATAAAAAAGAVVVVVVVY